MKRRLMATTSSLIALLFLASTMAAVPLAYADSGHGRSGKGGAADRSSSYGSRDQSQRGPGHSSPAPQPQRDGRDKGSHKSYASKDRAPDPRPSYDHRPSPNQGKYPIIRPSYPRPNTRPSYARPVRYGDHRPPYGGYSHNQRPVHVPSHWKRPTVVYNVPRYRSYHGVTVIRPYGIPYAGFAFYSSDSDAWKWLAFTAITLKILDNINEEQQRRHEQAQLEATTAPVGETIYWNDGTASGSVTATREGRSTSGRYCREFRQQIKVGDRSEQAYGTACQQPDGSWEIVSSQR